MTSPPISNAFTVDVEDYFQVSAFADQVSPQKWGDYESRVVANTQRVLRLLDRNQTRGTFFILGWVADRYPGLVREIQRSGHEIGCHSYWHRLIYDMTRDEFREDLQRSMLAISEITGEPVTAYRAPSFSVIQNSLWALDLMIEAGIQCDSSVFPVHHDRYGIPDAERIPHCIERPAGVIREFPPSVCRIGRVNLPVAGGGYFRLLPYWLTRAGLSRVNQREQRPGMFYIHPWELDPDQPRLRGTWKSRFRHYQNLGSTERKLDRLLRDFSWGRMDDAFRQFVESTPPLPLAATSANSFDSAISSLPGSDHSPGSAAKFVLPR